MTNQEVVPVKQEQVQKQTAKTERKSDEPVEAADVRNEELAASTGETLDAIDDVLGDQLDSELLDFMDEALEENAEEFVGQYIQQGGE